METVTNYGRRGIKYSNHSNFNASGTRFWDLRLECAIKPWIFLFSCFYAIYIQIKMEITDELKPLQHPCDSFNAQL